MTRRAGQSWWLEHYWTKGNVEWQIAQLVEHVYEPLLGLCGQSDDHLIDHVRPGQSYQVFNGAEHGYIADLGWNSSSAVIERADDPHRAAAHTP